MKYLMSDAVKGSTCIRIISGISSAFSNCIKKSAIYRAMKKIFFALIYMSNGAAKFLSPMGRYFKNSIIYKFFNFKFIWLNKNNE